METKMKVVWNGERGFYCDSKDKGLLVNPTMKKIFRVPVYQGSEIHFVEAKYLSIDNLQN